MLARAVTRASGGEWSVDLVSIGPKPGRCTLEPGLVSWELPAATQPADPRDALSWELPAALDNADVVHVHEAFRRGSGLAIALAVQRHLPLCISDLGSETDGLVREVGAADLADLVVAFSGFGAGLIPTRRPVRIVPGGVDADVFTPAERPKRDRVVLVGPPEGEVVDHLIANVPRELGITVLWPCGQDGDAGLQSRHPDREIEIVMAPPGDERCQHLQHAVVAVLPSAAGSRVDPVGLPGLIALSPLESMACGTPVICGPAWGLTEYVQDDVTGWVVRDPDDLSRRLLPLASDRVSVERLGRQARARVERAWRLEVVGVELLATYSELAR